MTRFNQKSQHDVVQTSFKNRFVTITRLIFADFADIWQRLKFKQYPRKIVHAKFLQ